MVEISRTFTSMNTEIKVRILIVSFRFKYFFTLLSQKKEKFSTDMDFQYRFPLY